MKRFFLISVLALTAGMNAVAFPLPEDGKYLITGTEDLGGKEIHLEEGCPLVIKGGCIRNGAIWGEGNKLVWDGREGVFDGVRLEGWWSGKADDRMFAYHEDADHFPIVSSLFRFNEVEFFRPQYWLGKWSAIPVNPKWQRVYGNGVILFLTANKGGTVSGRWGKRYQYQCLFGNRFDPEGNLNYEYHDIEIRDNSEQIGRRGWGSDVGDFCAYCYFSILGESVLLNNIKTDGGGGLFSLYNVWKEIDQIRVISCKVRTNQFAFEILNMSGRTEYPVKCRSISLENSSFYQYAAQKYVGLISVVGNEQTGNLAIRSCSFDGTEKAGNLELTSARQIDVSNCLFRNQFLQSETETMIELYDCHDNVFRFSEPVGRHGYSFGGKNLLLRNNLFVFEGKAWPLYARGDVKLDERDNRYVLETGAESVLLKEAPFTQHKSFKLPQWAYPLLHRVYFNLF